MRRLIAAIAIGLLVAPLAAVADPTSAPATTQSITPDLAAQIEALIQKLSSDGWKDRQEAQEKLIALGAASKLRLQKLMLETSDPETRTRAEAAVQQIDENRATGPSYITMHLKEVAPREIIEELSRQAYAPMRVLPENLWTQHDWPKVTVDIDQQPFWAAIKEICKKTGLHLQNNGAEQGFVLMEGGADFFGAPSVISGPFMITANGASQTNSIMFANKATVMRMLNISFMVYAEPKLQVVNHSYMAKITQALDDKGQSISPPQQYGVSFSYDSSPAWPVSASLTLPKNPGKTIAKIEGSTALVLQTQSVIWEIPDLLNAKTSSKIVGARTFTFHEARLANGANNNADNLYKVKVSVGRDQVNQRLQSFINLNALQVLDESGKRLGNRGFNSGGDGTNVEYEINFDRNGNEGRTDVPVKMIWKLPLETKEKELTFKFTDLPLP